MRPKGPFQNVIVIHKWKKWKGRKMRKEQSEDWEGWGSKQLEYKSKDKHKCCQGSSEHINTILLEKGYSMNLPKSSPLHRRSLPAGYLVLHIWSLSAQMADLTIRVGSSWQLRVQMLQKFLHIKEWISVLACYFYAYRCSIWINTRPLMTP